MCKTVGLFVCCLIRWSFVLDLCRILFCYMTNILLCGIEGIQDTTKPTHKTAPLRSPDFTVICIIPSHVLWLLCDFQLQAASIICTETLA